MKKNDKILLIVFIAVFLSVTAIGLSYAYYTAVIDRGEESASVVSRAGSLELTYTDGVKQIIGANIYPGWQDTKTFTVKNTGDALTTYSIRLSNIVNNFSIAGSISISIVGSNGGKSLSKRPIPASDSSVIDYVSIGKGVTHTYSITVYYNNLDVDQNPDKGKSFSFQVGLGEALGYGDVPKDWDKAGSNTLLAGIKKNYASPTATLTNPITDASASNEAVMSLAPDDYGISYYFRGNVQNNFVSFAGMCWRIVRITGDGSVKLALYDYSSASCTNTGGDLAFARYSGDTYTTKFNENNDDNAYIGFMYGTPNSTTYAATHANINKSTILQNLETWYKAKLTSYTDKLADTIWCNDKSTVKDVTGNYFESANGVLNKYSMVYNGLGYQKELTMYGSGIKNYPLESSDNRFSTYVTGPSLICPKDNDGGKLSKFTVDDTVNGNGNLDYKIGLLTADEMVLAGMATYPMYTNNNYDQNSLTSYLISNANYYYWTLSPFDFRVDAARVWASFGGGGLGVGDVGPSFALRPVVSLKSATTISGGNGTSSSPFVIN